MCVSEQFLNVVYVLYFHSYISLFQVAWASPPRARRTASWATRTRTTWTSTTPPTTSRANDSITISAKQGPMPRTTVSTVRESFFVFYTTLFSFVLFYFLLYSSILDCFLFYSILLYSILFYFILLYSILFYSILFYSILFYSIIFYSILFYTILYHSFYSTVLVDFSQQIGDIWFRKEF